MLSVIIPTFNEMQNGYLENILLLLKNTDNIEVIIVDSASSDGTVDLINKFNFKIIETKVNSRAKRLNLGIQASTGDMLLLHHPRSLLSVSAIHELIQDEEELYWGGFTHKFDHSSLLLKFTSWYSNHIRADKRHIFYLDHCIFAKREFFDEMGKIPEVDIFEDTELSKIFRSYSDSIRLDGISTTSAIRFTKNGIMKQALKNQILKWKYYFNMDHKKMNKEYEENLDLNSSYKDE